MLEGLQAFQRWSYDLCFCSHMSVERPRQLCHGPHSSVVQHLLFCNNNFISACEYVTNHPPRAQREEETHFIRLRWKHDTKDNIVVASLWPLRLWCDAERRGAADCTPSPKNVRAKAIWPTTSSMWRHRGLGPLADDRGSSSSLSNFSWRDSVGATFNHAYENTLICCIWSNKSFPPVTLLHFIKWKKKKKLI